MKKIEPERTLTEWEWHSGIVPIPQHEVTCSECESDRLNLVQLSVDKQGDTHLMNIIFGCEDCEELSGTQLKIDRRRFSYFQMKFGEKADVEEFGPYIEA